MHNIQNDFEDRIRKLTQGIEGQGIEGQYLRPWMITPSVKDPFKTDVFIVGFNQRNAFDAKSTNYEEFFDSLFNKNGQECRSFYENKILKSSPTRRTIDNFVEILKAEGISQILQTNVVCYSSPMSTDVTEKDHLVGTEIFKYLIKSIKPKVIIVHGEKATKELSAILQIDIGKPSKNVNETRPIIRSVKCDPQDYAATTVIVTPSLASPQANKWAKWRDDNFFNELTKMIKDGLSRN